MINYKEEYLRLLELAIGDGLHGRACRPLSRHGRRHVWWAPILNKACKLANKVGLELCLPREGGWPDLGDTMLPVTGLRNIRDVLTVCHNERIWGDFVECGCWRGGACVYARAVIDAIGDNRKVIGCDSFEGLPLIVLRWMARYDWTQ